MPVLHPHTWAHDLLDSHFVPERNATIILCGMWALWMARNNRRHGQAGVSVRQAVQWSIDTAFDLWNIMHPQGEGKAPKQRKHWMLPEQGWIKCNADAAYKDDDRTCATGFLLRDSDGRCCGGGAKWYDHCLDALTAETMACRDGMLLARSHRVRQLHLETDCQILANLWEQRDTQRSEISGLLQQIDDLIGILMLLNLVLLVGTLIGWPMNVPNLFLVVPMWKSGNLKLHRDYVVCLTLIVILLMAD